MSQVFRSKQSLWKPSPLVSYFRPRHGDALNGAGRFTRLEKQVSVSVFEVVRGGECQQTSAPRYLGRKSWDNSGRDVAGRRPAAGGVGAAGKETKREAAGEASPLCRKSLFQTPLSLYSLSHLVFTNLFNDFINGVPERQSWNAMAMFL